MLTEHHCTWYPVNNILRLLPLLTPGMHINNTAVPDAGSLLQVPGTEPDGVLPVCILGLADEQMWLHTLYRLYVEPDMCTGNGKLLTSERTYAPGWHSTIPAAMYWHRDTCKMVLSLKVWNIEKGKLQCCLDHPPSLRNIKKFQTTQVARFHSIVTFVMRLLLLLAAVVPFVMVAGTNLTHNCPTFECFNNSTCANSTANFTQFLTHEGGTLDVHKEIQRNGMHCACEKGWTGLRCATPYESCIYSGINDTGLTC